MLLGSQNEHVSIQIEGY